MQSNANFLLGKCPTFLFNKERQMSVVKKKKNWKHALTICVSPWGDEMK